MFMHQSTLSICLTPTLHGELLVIDLDLMTQPQSRARLDADCENYACAVPRDLVCVCLCYHTDLQ